MKPNLLLIDSRGTRQACGQHGKVIRNGECPKCAARKRCEELRKKYGKRAV